MASQLHGIYQPPSMNRSDFQMLEPNQYDRQSKAMSKHAHVTGTRPLFKISLSNPDDFRTALLRSSL